MNENLLCEIFVRKDLPSLTWGTTPVTQLRLLRYHYAATPGHHYMQKEEEINRGTLDSPSLDYRRLSKFGSQEVRPFDLTTRSRRKSN